MILYRLLLPLLCLRLLWRWFRGLESGRDLRARLFGPRLKRPTLWLHGASNGELGSARPLIEALLARDPQRHLLVTANTVTGRDFVADWNLERVVPALAPLDLHHLARRLFRDGATGLILFENELWPNRILAAHAARRPVLLIAARMSPKSARAWRRMGRLPRMMLGSMALIAPQDEASCAHLRGLGAPEAAIAPLVDLKSLYQPRGLVPDRALAAAFARERTLLAASTHAGEEEIVIDAFRRALSVRPDLRLILAPRHPHRASRIGDLIAAAGMKHARRSIGAAPDGQIYLADTMGEMELWYRLASAAFIGGSLADRGGHTPYEPAALGCAILHGPFTRNFAAPYARLDAGGGAVQVRDAESLAAAWLAHVNHSPLPARAAELLRPADLGALVERIEATLAQTSPAP